MRTKKQIRKIRKNTFKMGNKMYEKFNKEGNIEELRASVRAYDVSLKAMKYGFLYGKK